MKCPKCKGKMVSFSLQSNKIGYRCSDCGTVRHYIICDNCGNYISIIDILAQNKDICDNCNKKLIYEDYLIK